VVIETLFINPILRYPRHRFKNSEGAYVIMLTRIVLFALVVGLGYLNYTNPKIDDHKAFLLAELEQTYPVPEAMQERIWAKLDYSNFFVCSFMKTSVGSTMISSGFMKKVKLVDTEWADKIRSELQRKAETY
jgi:hypothetical protein